MVWLSLHGIILLVVVIVVGAECGDGMVFDCWLQCVDEATLLAWVGDGYCDDNTGNVLRLPGI